MTLTARVVLVVASVFVTAASAAALSQGPNGPASLVNDASFGTNPWLSPANAATSNNMYAFATPLLNPTNYLRATNFGFSIPGGAVIEGIEVRVEKVSTAGTIVDARVRIIKGGVIGATDRSIVAPWSNVESIVTYGNNSDLWGETWSASDINSSAFGFVISADDNLDTAFVDAISITVFYSICGDSQTELSEECDDGNTLNGDCCSSTCEFEANGSPCPDNDLCNGDESCDGAGECVDGPPLDCDDANVCTQDSCDAQDGCINTTSPQGGCRTATKGLLTYKDNTNNAKDKLIYKWIKGASTTFAEFGVPTGTTDYTLCLYAGTGAALGGATIQGGAPNWAVLGSNKGYKYKDSSGSSEGITKAQLKASLTSKTKIIVKGKGINLPDLPAMPFGDPEPVTAQLVNESNGICWETVFSAPFKKNADGKFKAKFP